MSPDFTIVSIAIQWANNGDTISRQYAGTAALKSDFTRTGERKLAGMFKDSYNSATRYYKNRFRDTFRQGTIDIMTTGLHVSDLEYLNSPDEDEISVLNNISEDKDHHERIRQVIEDCKRYLVPENEIILGGWPLVDAEVSTISTDMDIVLILTKDCYFVAEYDDSTDRITNYQRVNLEDLEKIEFGPVPGSNLLSSKLSSSSKYVPVISSKKHSKITYCIRLFYVDSNGTSGYFHMLKPTMTRFFNNMVIPIRTTEEEMESLKSIIESFKVALSVKSLNVPIFEGKLEKKRNKNIMFGHGSNLTGFTSNLSGFTMNTLELAKNVGTYSDKNIIKNVGKSAISKFNKFKGKFNYNHSSSNKSSMFNVINPVVINEPKTSSSLSDEQDLSDNEEMSNMNNLCQSYNNDDNISNISSSVFVKGSGSDAASDNLSDDLEDDDDRDMITPTLINADEEICSLPVNINEQLSNEEEISSCDKLISDDDAILESCGIINVGSLPRRMSNERTDSPVISAIRTPVLNEVDDFVLDSIKKAGLKQLRRKASGNSEQHSNEVLTRVDENVLLSYRADDMTRSYSHLEPFNSNNFNMSTSCATLALPASNAMYQNNSSNSSSHADSSSSKSAGMKNSRSEAEMFGSHFSDLIAPSNFMRKDLVMSPLSRIAKGVQSFGQQLRHPGSSPSRRNKIIQTNLDPAAFQELQEKKKLCKSKIIEL